MAMLKTQEGSGSRGDLLGHLCRHGQDLAQVPELGQSKHLQGIPTKAQSQNKAAGPEVEGSNDPPGAGCPGGGIGGF